MEGINNRLVFHPKFNQTLLFRHWQNSNYFYYGLKICYLNEKSLSLLGLLKRERLNSHFEIKPVERQFIHGLVYLTKIYEVFGYKIFYDHNETIKHRGDYVMGSKIDLIHIYPVSISNENDI